MTTAHEPPGADVLCFFLVSVAFKLPWTSISSLLSQLADIHGPRSLLWLNLAYFLPPMPLLLLMSAGQGRLDRALGVRRSALLRFAVGLGGLAAMSTFFPSAAEAPGMRPMLVCTALIGAAYSVAFGTAYQLAPSFGPGCTVALTAGFVSAGCVVLLLDVAIKRGAPAYTPPQLQTLFVAVTAVVLGGLAAAATLVQRHARRLHAPLRSGSGSGGGSGADLREGGGSDGGGLPVSGRGGSTLSVWHRPHRQHPSGQHQQQNQHHHHQQQHQQHQQQHEEGVDPSHPHHNAAAGGPDVEAAASFSKTHHPTDGGWWAVAHAAAPAAAALLVSVGSSMLAFPFFSYIPTDGRLGRSAASAAFYARLGGDIAGRLLPPRLQIRTRRRLAVFAGAKAALLPVLLVGLLRPPLVGGDLGLVALVVLNWGLSGYVNTGAYLVAPALVPSPQQRSRVGGFMALCFQVSCFLGLMGATLLQHLLHTHMAPHLGAAHAVPQTAGAVTAAAAAAAAPTAAASMATLSSGIASPA